MVTFTTLLLLGLSAPAQGQACARLTSPAQFADLLQAAESSWAGADAPGFFSKMEETALLLPCLDAPLEPALAARYHRDMGLWLWATDQPDQARLAFAAARRLEPHTGLSAALVPAAHPARESFEASEPDQTGNPVPPPASGRLLFDGSEGPRPAGSNTIVQLEDAGMVSLTSYLHPDSALPPYEPHVAPAPAPVRAQARRWVFPAAAGAAALAAGGTALAAYGTRRSFEAAPPDDLTGLEALYDRNHRLTNATIALGGTAGALGVVAAFTW